MTPEGKVKSMVNKIIDRYGKDIYKFMPVPAGYGPSSLDYILCIRGLFVAIETKAPGKKLSARQHFTRRQIMDAGGKVFIVENEVDMTEVVEFFNWLLPTIRTPEEIIAWPDYLPKSPKNSKKS